MVAEDRFTPPLSAAYPCLSAVAPSVRGLAFRLDLSDRFTITMVAVHRDGLCVARGRLQSDPPHKAPRGVVRVGLGADFIEGAGVALQGVERVDRRLSGRLCGS
jgi:hypothetical protein